MSIEERRAIVCELLEEAYSKGNAAIGDKHLAFDSVFHTPPEPDISGIENWKKFVIMWRTAFPDCILTVEDTIAEGDKVVASWSARATHKGELRGIAPTWKQVTISGVAIYRFVGNKIAEIWGWRDTFGLMQQLGVIPPRQ